MPRAERAHAVRNTRLERWAAEGTPDADGLKLVEKGRRNGQELRWADLVSGNAALNAALSASTER